MKDEIKIENQNDKPEKLQEMFYYLNKDTKGILESSEPLSDKERVVNGVEHIEVNKSEVEAVMKKAKEDFEKLVSGNAETSNKEAVQNSKNKKDKKAKILKKLGLNQADIDTFLED